MDTVLSVTASTPDSSPLLPPTHSIEDHQMLAQSCWSLGGEQWGNKTEMINVIMNCILCFVDFKDLLKVLKQKS